MADNKRQRDVVDATSREIAKLDGERLQAKRDVAVALADAHSRLLAQLGAIVHDVDTEIATVTSKAKAASGPAAQQLATLAARLKERRDALVAKAASLKGTAAGQWSAAKADLDVSLDELQYLRDNGMVGIN